MKTRSAVCAGCGRRSQNPEWSIVNIKGAQVYVFCSQKCIGRWARKEEKNMSTNAEYERRLVKIGQMSFGDMADDDPH